jgi:ribulose kinase
MSHVLGVDFGTLSMRVSAFDHQAGRLRSGTAPYPLKRKKEDPKFATQVQADQQRAAASTAAPFASLEDAQQVLCLPTRFTSDRPRHSLYTMNS